MAFRKNALQIKFMNSMTGHGRAKTAKDGRILTVELSAVNRKQLEIFIALPRPLAGLETRLREEIGASITRGRINASVTLQEGQAGRTGAINFAAASHYHQQ